MQLADGKIVARFGERRHKMGMLGACERDHSKAVRKRREVLLELVRGPARRNKLNLVEIKAPVRGARYRQVAVMNRIERAAEKRNAARSMFGGGAVHLGGGQRGS